MWRDISGCIQPSLVPLVCLHLCENHLVTLSFQERMKQQASCNIYRAGQPKYAYVANLCVAKHYRRQGIATNMLLLAIEAAATSYGKNELSLVFLY